MGDDDPTPGRPGLAERDAGRPAPDPAAGERSGRPHYTGHRQRLRQRFLDGGPDALPDYELLELLLFLAQPRGDVKPLAKDLLARFGSFAEVIAAAPADLMTVKGLGEAGVVALKTAEESARRLLRREISERPVIASWEALIDYCHAAMARRGEEEFRVLFLDRRHRLIADEVQQRGTIDHTPLYPREVCKRALELRASALVLVHNHPSGDPTPSVADVDMTREVKTVAKGLGMTVHDHLIIARSGHCSLAQMGLL
ncbi:RadC family protein [Roseospirillum parvum]|uniref:DNA repair protein RadC n=1 Tax=Roseospirillum parvum TaxID=83401 RepID=A0A1G7W0F8_9PROT|nr:DNA repair protein RadC [Roseospirillum parvum]SDG64620.1 DNA repair protein RadC [Roseospirillum parvum]